MEKQLTFWKKLQNPFLRIAGAAALGIGLAGICLNSLFCWLTDLHFQGLLHIGPAPTDAFGVIFAEHLIIWLIPAFLFYLWGQLPLLSFRSWVSVFSDFFLPYSI